MRNEMYRKLIDLYAGGELPEELEREMQAAASDDADLAQEMMSLRSTVNALRESEAPEFTEESYQRVLMSVYTKGVAMQPRTPTPDYLQYQLPMQG